MRSAPRRCTSRRCCRANRTRRATDGPSTATNIFRLQDRKGADYLLGPTHEEMFTLLVKDLYSSYKDLPVSLYQIQTKYRDEARPRAGILRGREFVMKDSYSFDVDDEGLRALVRTRTVMRTSGSSIDSDSTTSIVAAMSGAMGGSASEEFLADCENGEDTYVRCTTCDYAANVEAVRDRAAEPVDFDGLAGGPRRGHPRYPDDRHAWSTSSTRDFARGDRAVARRGHAEERRRHARHPDGRREPLAHRCSRRPRGRREAVAGAGRTSRGRSLRRGGLRRRIRHCVKGYIGPARWVRRQESGIRFLVDPRMVDGTAWVTGANEDGRHVLHLVAGRDFTADGTIEAAEVREGDTCPVDDGRPGHRARNRDGPYLPARSSVRRSVGPEGAGRERQAGDASPWALTASGSRARLPQLSRTRMTTSGLSGRAKLRRPMFIWWPRARTSRSTWCAEALALELEATDLRVLYDDRRKVSPGVKFKDAELLGMPTIVVIGKNLADGVIEVRDRQSGERRAVPVAEAAARIHAGARAEWARRPVRAAQGSLPRPDGYCAIALSS